MSVNSSIKAAKIKTLTRVASQDTNFQMPQQVTPISGIANFLSFALDEHQKVKAQEEATQLQQELQEEDEVLSGAALRIRELRQIARDGTYTAQQLRNQEEKILAGLTGSQKMETLSRVNKLTGVTSSEVLEANRVDRDTMDKEREETIISLAELQPYIEKVEGVNTESLGTESTENLKKLLIVAKSNQAQAAKEEADLRLLISQNQEIRAQKGQAQTEEDRLKEEALIVGAHKFRTIAGYKMLQDITSKDIPDSPEEVGELLKSLDTFKENSINQFQDALIGGGFTVRREEVEAELKPLLDIADNYKKFVSGDEYFKIAKNQREILTENILSNLAKNKPEAYTSLLLAGKGLITRDVAQHLPKVIEISVEDVRAVGNVNREKAIKKLMGDSTSREEATRIVNKAVDYAYSLIAQEEPLQPLTPEEKEENVNLIYNPTNVNSPHYEENLRNGTTKKAIDKMLIEEASPSDFPSEESYERVLQSSLSAAEDFIVRAATRVEAGEVEWDGDRFISPRQTDKGTRTPLLPKNHSQVVYLNQLIEKYNEKSDKDIKELINDVLGRDSISPDNEE